MINVAIVAAIGIGAYLSRLSFIAALGSRRVPPVLSRALEYVAPAVLAAIVFPAVVRPDGPIDLTPANLRLLAGLAAGVVAWRTKNVALTTAVGLGSLWALQAVV